MQTFKIDKTQQINGTMHKTVIDKLRQINTIKPRRKAGIAQPINTILLTLNLIKKTQQ